jgi:phosphoglucosamine mutase
MSKVFGTDGIRGKVGVYPLTEDMICNIGKAAAVFVQKTNPHNRKSRRISIAKDTRISAEMFEAQLIKGIISRGTDVIKLGVMATPCAAFIGKKSNHDMTIVISASHNDIEDNGLKFFSSKGYKLNLKEEEDMEHIIMSLVDEEASYARSAQAEDGPAAKPYQTPGAVRQEDDAISLYVDLLKHVIGGNDISGYKIAVDCAFGAISYIMPILADRLGLDIKCLNNTPNGENINKHCGSLYPGVVSGYVVDNNLDCGIALDGDGDRVILCDEKGQVLDGDFILAIISKYLFQQGALNKNSVVSTHMSNIGLEIAISQWGGRIIKTDVGDKHVLDKMSRAKINLGGEQSGHIILLDYSTTGDGLLAALFVLRIMAQEKKPLSALSRYVYKFPQVLLNVDVERKIPIEELTRTRKVIEKAEKKLGAKGRLYIRYSGTENKLRIMIEGQNSQEIKETAEDIANTAREELDAKIRR